MTAGSSSTRLPFRRLGGVTVPVRWVRVLSGVVVASAVALPWLAEWQGVTGSPPAEREEVNVDRAEVIQLRPEMVRLPGGTFMMGSPMEETGRENNEQQHEATVAPFEICRTEVTQAQWKAAMGTEPFDRGSGVGPDLPAQNISWEMAVEYLATLTERENALGESTRSQCYEKVDGRWEWTDLECTGYRLPTETEWEYAARAGTTTAYSFGDDSAALDDHAWHPGNSENKVHTVVTKKANPWKLNDMHGNVLEWVWDWYAEEYPADAKSLGFRGPPTGEYRVIRGGSFGNNPLFIRSAFRGWDHPSFAHGIFGFRCVRGVGPESLTP